MRTVLAGVVGLGMAMAVSIAQAEDCRGPEGLAAPETEYPLVPFEFRRTAGRGPACVLPPDETPPPEIDPAHKQWVRPKTYLPCLKIGPIRVGDRLKDVEEVLDTAERITPLSEDAEVRIYFTQQRSDPLPYFVVTYLKDVVMAVQLYGPATEMPLGFSSINLGDSQQKILDVLGMPVKRCKNRERGFEAWSWPPYPFAIDINPKTGQVVGMKVSIPNEKER